MSTAIPFYSGRINLAQAKENNTRPVSKELVEDLVVSFKNSVEDYSFPILVVIPDGEQVNAKRAFDSGECFNVEILVIFIFC
jgi:hypothetical protein